MEKKQHKLLLTALENASSEDTDLFLQVDLNQSFAIMAKERYDNNFDLAKQFDRERDTSRNFRIYGEVASTVIDCNNLTIRIFSDENYTNEIGSIQTSSVSYNTENVFGKKKGKYLIELDNFLFDVVYLQIDSDNFSYSTQRWSQRVVFYDADGVFVSYGTETVDINFNGDVVVVENNFPFFFNKHWVRLDYNIIEEKIAQYSWQTPETNISEGNVVERVFQLNKPSPFGNEQLTLNWSNRTRFENFYTGFLSETDIETQSVISQLNIVPQTANVFTYVDFLPFPYPEVPITAFNPIGSQSVQIAYNNWIQNISNTGLQLLYVQAVESTSPILASAQEAAAAANTAAENQVDTLTFLSQYNGNVMVLVLIYPENDELFQVGLPFRILNGNYQGEYTIVGRYINTDVVNAEGSYYNIILDTPYNEASNPANGISFSVGSPPDINVFLNGETIQFPIDLTWQVGEQFKNFTFAAAEDLEIELEEFYVVEANNENRVEAGPFPYHGIYLEDTTLRRQVRYHLQSIYENRQLFTGRTYYDSVFPENFEGTTEGPAVLRNGNFWEGRNEEFYANDAFIVTIKNDGQRTVFPANPNLGVVEPFVFQPQESKSFFVESKYSPAQPHTVRLVYETDENGNDIEYSQFQEQYGQNENPFLYINGVRIFPSVFLESLSYKYEYMKQRLDGGQEDWFVSYGMPKQFNTIFDDINKTITLISKSPGVRLIVTTTNPALTIEQVIPFQDNPQIETTFDLNVNTNENQDARYEITLSKPGFKDVYIPPNNIVGGFENPTNAYLVTAYSNMLYPFDTALGQVFYDKNANDVIGTPLNIAVLQQPSNMERGDVFVNGALFLSDGTLPFSKNNITEQGVFLNGNIDNEFFGRFQPQPLVPIPATAEVIVSQASRAIWELFITAMPSSIPSEFSGIRSFDLTIGEGDGAYTLTIGGMPNQGTLGNAASWWNSTIPVSDENGQFSVAFLRDRLDTGDLASGVPEGPFSGSVETSYLKLISKQAGVKIEVSNIVNFDGYNEGETENVIEAIGNFLQDIFQNIFNTQQDEENQDISPFAIKAKELAPGLAPGEPNIGRNGLGGFALELE